MSHIILGCLIVYLVFTVLIYVTDLLIIRQRKSKEHPIKQTITIKLDSDTLMQSIIDASKERDDE